MHMCASTDRKRDREKERRPVAPSSMELEYEAFLLRGHSSTLEVRPEVVDPAKPATFSCPVETYKRRAFKRGRIR